MRQLGDNGEMSTWTELGDISALILVMLETHRIYGEVQSDCHRPSKKGCVCVCEREIWWGL